MDNTVLATPDQIAFVYEKHMKRTGWCCGLVTGYFNNWKYSHDRLTGVGTVSFVTATNKLVQFYVRNGVPSDFIICYFGDDKTRFSVPDPMNCGNPAFVAHLKLAMTRVGKNNY